MSVNLILKFFYLFLFLLMCSTLCGQVSATADAQTLTAKNSVDLFKENKIGGAKGPEGKAAKADVEVKDYYSPIILLAGDVFVTLAGVKSNNNPDKSIYVITNYTEKNKLLESEKGVLTINKDDWTTQFAVENKQIQDADKVVKSLLAVTKDDKIYVLSVICTKTTKDGTNSFNFALYFVDGTVIDKDSSKKIFVWKDLTLTANDVADKLKNEFGNAEIDNFLFSGSAFLLDKETIVFAFVAKDKQKNLSALIQLKNNQIESKFVNEEIFKNCQPYFFPWKKKIIIVPVDCNPNKNKIKELSDIEKEWSNSKEAFSSHYEFLKDKHDFVTIKNDTTEILLFTEHTQTANPPPPEKKINLWMSDGTRLKNIGEIVKGSEAVTAINFLFADGNLFFLDQQLKTGKEIERVTLNYLKEQSKKIKDTINAWSTTDTKISNLCKEQKTSKIFCTTNGLVGFLSGNKEKKESGNNEWKNEYLNVNAIFNSQNGNEATELPDGFTFSGKGAGAQWPVSKAENEKWPYNFINSGFTLLATVTTHEVPAGDYNSILGIVFADGSKTINLWCSNKKEWVVGEKEKPTNSMLTSERCEQKKPYKIVFMLEKEKNELNIYIDGNKLNVPRAKNIKVNERDTILHFYFGADKDQSNVETQVTIKNVLLYNRPFNDTELNNLKVPKVAETTSAKKEKDRNNVSDQETNDNLLGTSTATKNNEEEEAQSSSPPPPTTEDSAVRAGVVGVLCFMLFGVFTLLGRYVY